MSRDLIRQLKNLKHREVSPREEWLRHSRDLLLSQIKNTVAPQSKPAYHVDNVWTGMSIFLPKSLVYSVIRPLAVLIIVTMVATSGWVTTVDASYNALPGDWLYPAKRAAEKTQVAVAAAMGAKTTETKLHSEFAKRRATEAKQIVKNADPQKNEKVFQVVQDLKKEIQTVNDSLASDQNGQLSANTVKGFKQDYEQIKNVLQEVRTDLIVSATSTSSSTTQMVNEAKDLVKDAGVKAAEVLVAKHLEGDTSVSSADVKKELSNTLNSVATDVDQNKQSIAATQAVVEAAQAGVQKETTAGPISSSTQALSDRIDVVAADTKVAAEQTSAAKVVADQKIGEAKDLLDKGDLASALGKVKEAAAATNEAEKISDETLTKAQSILPVASVIKEVAPVLGVTSTALQILVTTTPASGTPAILQVIVTTTPVAPSTTVSTTKK